MTATAFSTVMLGKTYNFGLCEAVGTERVGTRVNVYFASPTGGASDSLVFALDALDELQAENWWLFVQRVAKIQLHS